MDTATRIADTLLDGFDRHYSLFRATSACAKDAFDAGDWPGVQRLVKERIRFYDERVVEYVERLSAFAADAGDEAWQQAKLLYVGRLIDHKRPELAETFFNSVTTRVLRHTYVHDDLMFMRAAVSTEYIPSDPPSYRSYYPHERGLRAAFVEIFRDVGWSRPFADLDRDIDCVMRAIREPRPEPNFQVQVLGSALYRNKAAYVVGKIVNGHEETAFVVPVLHDDDGRLMLDTILLEQQSIDVLFSLSRAYFLVDMDVPSGYVEFWAAGAKYAETNAATPSTGYLMLGVHNHASLKYSDGPGPMPALRHRGRRRGGCAPSSTRRSASPDRARRSSSATCGTTCTTRTTSSTKRPAHAG